MKNLLAKVLLAQVATVVMALVIVALITRASLNRGFIDFLERQEADVLSNLAPALADYYDARDGWGFLRDHPDNWQHILRQARGLPHAPPGGRDRFAAPGQQPLRWLRSMDRMQFRERLFLLDAERRHVAGAPVGADSGSGLQAVDVEGKTVGWIGFVALKDTLPPEASRFLGGQVRVLGLSLLIALGLAGLLGYVLARQVSRPVGRLEETVTALAHGEYEKRAEARGDDEIARLANTVNQLAETLEKNRTARHRWMADIAHELRTPVAILKGEIEALADGIRPLDHTTITSLNEEIDQLAALVDDLQTLALSDAGALNLRRENLDLAEIVATAAEPFRGRFGERGIDLALDLQSGLSVAGDPQRLRQLVHNLLENCWRYVVTSGRVLVTAAVGAGAVELTVQDSGPGVAPSQLELLFDRFYRAEQGRSRVGGGSGLGLAICRNIVEAHGGRIEARPSPLGGLCISATLPQ